MSDIGSIVLAGGTVGGSGTRWALQRAVGALDGLDAVVIAPSDVDLVVSPPTRVRRRGWSASLLREMIGADRADHYIGFADRLPLIRRAGRRSQVMVVQNRFLYQRGTEWEASNGMKVAALRWWARRSVAKADLIVCSSEASADELVEFTSADRSRIVVRPIPVSVDIAPKENHREELIRFVLVGDLYRHKRFDLALDAITAFATSAARACEVVHLGRPIENEALASFEAATARASRADVSVERRGGVARSEVLAEMVGADATVMLSTIETQGVPLAEAMAVGLPVVCLASDVFVEQGRDAVVTVAADRGDRSIDVRAVADAITTIDPRSTRVRMAARGLELSDGSTDWWLLGGAAPG